jgi:hypothetical protein
MEGILDRVMPIFLLLAICLIVLGVIGSFAQAVVGGSRADRCATDPQCRAWLVECCKHSERHLCGLRANELFRESSE